jgi:hypothetical protein
MAKPIYQFLQQQAPGVWEISHVAAVRSTSSN